MTNGDKFLEKWPNTDVKFDYAKRVVLVDIGSGFTSYTPIDMDWWEDEYEEGMQMTIDQERTYIMQHPKYKNSVKWKDRVMRMPDPQVHAIYKQFQKADYNKIARELKAQNKENANYHQVDMFEYMEELKGDKE